MSYTKYLVTLALFSTFFSTLYSMDSLRIDLAAIHGDDKAIDALIKSGVDLKSRDAEWALLWSAIKGNNETALKLVRLGVNPDSTGMLGSVLTNASGAKGSIELVKELLAHGAKINTTRRGDSPLYAAVFEDRGDIIDILLDAGADIEKGSICDDTPLHVARSVPTIRKLILRGADVNSRTVEGKTPIMSMCGYSRYKPNVCDLIRELIASGADVNAQTYPSHYLESALHLAASEFNAEIVKILLEAGANPNLLAYDKLAPISYLIKRIVKMHSECAKEDKNKAVETFLALHAATKQDLLVKDVLSERDDQVVTVAKQSRMFCQRIF